MGCPKPIQSLLGWTLSCTTSPASRRGHATGAGGSGGAHILPFPWVVTPSCWRMPARPCTMRVTSGVAGRSLEKSAICQAARCHPGTRSMGRLTRTISTQDRRGWWRCGRMPIAGTPPKSLMRKAIQSRTWTQFSLTGGRVGAADRSMHECRFFTSHIGVMGFKMFPVGYLKFRFLGHNPRKCNQKE